jgi:hypothetical protein
VLEALDYQSLHGGYFGEALLALEVVSREELEWGLASQFDLPYIFPDAESIDPDAANMVSPEWALSHLSLPIMRAGETLTVVVDSPLRTEVARELEERTGLQVQLALASSVQIRELIRQVYARATAREEGESHVPVSLEEALARALGADAHRFGVSAREHRAWFWYDDGGTVRRRPLDARWRSALDTVAGSPILPEIGDARRATVQVELTRDGGVTRAELRYLASEAGREFLFLVAEDTTSHEAAGFPRPGEGILTEVRLLARTGSARFVVTSEPAGLARDILPHLPLLFFEPSWRSVHVHTGTGAPEAFSLKLPRASADRDRELEALRSFHFDVVTADVDAPAEEWLPGVLDVASVAFVRRGADADNEAASAAGIGWRLHVERTEGGHLDWSLVALES